MRTAFWLLCGTLATLLVVASRSAATAQDSPAEIVPSPAALQEFSTGPSDTPIYMLNLLKFAPGGRTEYFRYGMGAGKHLQQRGGSMGYIGRVEACSDASPAWDSVAIVRYPSRAEYLQIVADVDYQSYLPHLRAAIVRAMLHAFVNSEELPERLDATTADYGPDSIVVVGLQRLKPDSERAYEGYTRASRRLISQYGGGILFAADGEQLLVGDGQWDRLVLIHFPSLHQLQSMIESPAHQHVLELRGEAVADTLHFLTRPSAAP